MYGIIGALIGFFIFKNIWGAIIGFIIGGIFFRSKIIKNIYSNRQRINKSDFELHLLILSAFVIKSDGKVAQEELDYVRLYFVRIYGKNYSSEIFSKFKTIIQNDNVSIEKVCFQLQNTVTYPTKLQILHYLFGVAKSDAHISEQEINLIHRISNILRVNESHFISIKSMFVGYKRGNHNTVDNAYRILEIDKDASVQEIKDAYRKLAKLHHPDRIQHMGEAYVKGAKEKFTVIQNAYETIKKYKNF